MFVRDLVTGSLTRVSVAYDGAGGDGSSFTPVLSNDARQVAFFSYASNLVAGDTNAAPDVFVRNLYRPFQAEEDGVIGLPIRVAAAEPGETVTEVVFTGLPSGSLLSAGTMSDAGATWTFSGPLPANLTMTAPPNFSGAFTLMVTATTSQAGAFATSTGAVTVSVSAVADAPTLVNDVATTNEDQPVTIDVLANDSDADGDALQITSIAGQAVNPGDTVGLGYASGSTATLNANGTILYTPGANASGVELFGYAVDDGNGGSALGSVSVTVNPVAAAPSIAFGNNVRVDALERVSVAADGADGNGVTNGTAIFSSDGTRVVFVSAASNLVPNDTNGFTDVFVKNLVTGEVSLVSTTASGAQSDQNNTPTFAVPNFSPDGNKVAFYSNATNLVPGDTNGFADMFVKDLVTGQITLVSTTAAGVQGNGNTINTPIWSPDGTKLMFTSQATNFSPSDTNSQYDVYIKDLVTGEITLVSANEAGVAGGGPAFAPGTSSPPRFNTDGTKVVFESASPLTAPGTDTNFTFDIFVKDLTTGVVTRVSTDGAGGQANGGSFNPTFSPDGRKVMFWSAASNLVGGDLNNAADVFVKDLLTGAITLVSADSNGIHGNGLAVSAQWSPDGRYVIFWSASSNLVPGDTNGVADVFAKDLVTGAVSRLSITADGGQTDGGSGTPLFSYDGASISFNSAATNLVPGDTNASVDLFVAKILQPFRAIEDGKIGLPITVASAEAGETVTQVVLSGLPAGSVLSAGATSDGGMTWTFNGPPPANLSMTPPADYAGEFTLTVIATSAQGAAVATSTASKVVVVTPVADAANIAFESLAPIDLADTQVNTTTANTQAHSAVTVLPDGGYVVAWMSIVSPTGGTPFASIADVYMQRYDASGAAIGGQIRVNSTAPGITNQSAPSIATLVDGSFVVTWNLYTGASNDFEVWARRFNADGTPTAPDFPVTFPFTPGGDGLATVAALPDGGYLIAWEELNGTDSDVVMQRYSAADVRVGGRFEISQDGVNNVQNEWVDLAVLNDGSFVAAWSSSPEANFDDIGRIYMRRFDSAGVPLGDAFALTSDALHDETMPTMAALADGGFVIAFSSFQREGVQNGLDVYFQRFDASGARVGIETLAYANPIDGQGYATIAALSDGGFVVSYVSGFGLRSDGIATGSEDMFAQRFDAAGNRVGEPVRINATAAGTQWTETFAPDPVFAVTPDGVLVHTFYGDGEIHLRRFDTHVFGGEEGGQINLPITIKLATGETITEVVLAGLPAGSVLSAGTSNDGGATWTFAGAPPADLSLTGPAGYSGSFTLTVTATTGQGASSATSSSSTTVTVAAANVAPPLIVDLGGDGVHLISGVSFDFDGDGILERGGWASSRDAFLALDRNQDGAINGIGEISFVGDMPGATSDLQGLRAFDSNSDGTLSAADIRFGDFSLWQDANSNGISEAGELRPLAEAGVISISLQRTGAASTMAGGTILGYAAVSFVDGSTTVAADTLLGYGEATQARAMLIDVIETNSASYMPQARALIRDGYMLGTPNGAVTDFATSEQVVSKQRASFGASDGLDTLFAGLSRHAMREVLPDQVALTRNSHHRVEASACDEQYLTDFRLQTDLSSPTHDLGRTMVEHPEHDVRPLDLAQEVNLGGAPEAWLTDVAFDLRHMSLSPYDLVPC